MALNIDIENIDKIENIYKNHKGQRRTIYKVIQQEFFDETENLLEKFIKQFKNNANEPFNIPNDVKNNLKRIKMEHGLYTKVVMIHRRGLKTTEENKDKMRISSSSMVILQDHSIGLIFNFIVLKKILEHVKLISIRKTFKVMMKHKIQIHLNFL